MPSGITTGVAAEIHLGVSSRDISQRFFHRFHHKSFLGFLPELEILQKLLGGIPPQIHAAFPPGIFAEILQETCTGGPSVNLPGIPAEIIPWVLKILSDTSRRLFSGIYYTCSTSTGLYGNSFRSCCRDSSTKFC